MRIVAAAVVGGAAALLAACETTGRPAMSAAQCATADWKAIGYQDGASGRAPERFVSRQEACVGQGYGADQELYMAGRREGLWTWCQPERAFQLGLNGNSYNGVCPPDLDGVFRDAHGDGMRAHRAVSELKSAESTISSLRSDIDNIDRKITANQIGFDASQTDAERDRHRNEITRLRDERHRLFGRLRDADDDAREASRNVRWLRGEIGLRWGSW